MFGMEGTNDLLFAIPVPLLYLGWLFVKWAVPRLRQQTDMGQSFSSLWNPSIYQSSLMPSSVTVIRRMVARSSSSTPHEMDRGAKEAGVKRIRIHDLRHSHISLLIDMGFSAVAIADHPRHGAAGRTC